MTLEKLYTIAEVAEYLKVKERTVKEWIWRKKLKAIKVGKSWRVSESALREFLERGEGD
ncbi:MAG: helix-turn-helix domain-containing protein [Candidatus Methanomethyliaceae archaeon]